jgi:hypothetical protein
MDNFSISVNLAKLKNTQIKEMRNQDGEIVKCIIIPIEENNIQCFDHHESAYLNMTTRLCKDKPKYTHSLYSNIAHDVYVNMTQEERDANPIIGRMRPFNVKRNKD